jgi:acetyl esterase/lipase
MPWLGDEDYQPKMDRLLERIDRYRAKGHRVSLFGASAGASAVLNAYVERKDDITGLVYAFAKINAPETVSDKVYAANPAFKMSMEVLQANLKKLTPADKAKMHSFYSPDDNYVPYAATVIPGVRESRLPALRHGWSITYSLTLGAHKILSPLKKQARQQM